MATKETPATENEEALQAQIARSRIKLMAAAVVAVLALNAALGYVLYQSLVLDTQSQQLHQLSKKQAHSQADSIASATSKLQQKLKKLSLQPELKQAMAAGNTEQLGVITRVQQSSSEILSLRLFPLGSASVDRTHAYPIRFAELDMIYRAEKNERVPMEASENDQQWLLYGVFTISENDEVTGTGLVVSTADAFKNALRTADGSLGSTELLQNFNPSRPDTIAQHGVTQGNIEKYQSTAEIAGTHWTVRFTPSATLAQQAAVSPLTTILITLLSTVICLAAAIAGASFTAKRQLHRQIQQSIMSRTTSKGRAEHQKRKEGDLSNPIYQKEDVLDVAVNADDEDILGLNSSPTATENRTAAVDDVNVPDVPANIFRSYDIRGLADSEITPELATSIGQALGSEALDQGESSMVIARDCRNSSPELCSALIEGVKASGCNVINIGVVPSQLMYFATHHLGETSSGIMVTASHNPAPYNGFKMIVNGVTLADDAVTDIRTRILRSQYHSGQGTESEQDITPEYIDRILADVALAGDVHIVIDAGNGATSEAAPLMFEELGCEVTPLYCEFDGNFPNHQPDPSRSENLQDLIAKVAEVGADLGVAFDGDGDRLTIVTAKGRVIWPDQLLMLFARDILASNPGTDVLFDVKSTRLLNQVISSAGGRPIMWKTGHSHMKAKMIETGALLGGEFSGHIFIKHRWYGFDDGIYACARLLEIMTLRDQDLDEMIESFPEQVATEEIIVPVDDARKFTLVDELIASADFQNGERATVDGLRVDFGKGWGLVRASNTAAALTLRFEAESEETLQDLQALFKRELHKIDANLELNF